MNSSVCIRLHSAETVLRPLHNAHLMKSRPISRSEPHLVPPFPPFLELQNVSEIRAEWDMLGQKWRAPTDADRMLETVFFFAAVMPGGSSYLAKVMHAPPIAVMQLSRLFCESSPSLLTPFFHSVLFLP